MKTNTETYTINGADVSKVRFDKFLKSLRDRSSESCERRADGGRTSCYAVDAQGNRYEIIHDVTYVRDRSGDVLSSTDQHEIRRLNEKR